MDPPEPALAPVMLPVIVPIVQLNVLGVLDVRLMFVPTPLHLLTVAEFVTMGFGFTVTVIVNELPTHRPDTEVGVTIYCTVPADALLGLVRT